MPPFPARRATASSPHAPPHNLHSPPPSVLAAAVAEGGVFGWPCARHRGRGRGGRGGPSCAPRPIRRSRTARASTPRRGGSPRRRRSAYAASLPNHNPWEEAKVVVSVTVQGSVGPVKAMVRLGASVGEAIAAVVEMYGREGRSPRLDPAASDAFQLQHSHFCLQSPSSA